jgi:queuosine precursor transporter
LITSKQPYRWLTPITAIFITCLIVANIIAVKLISIVGLIVPAAVIVFPISYIIGDVLTEVYGYKIARQTIWLGFFCNLLAVGFIFIGQLLPGAAFWNGQEAYTQILGFAPRLLIASFIAYLIGEFSNSIILSRLKVITNGRWLWLRTISSTLIGQGLDSLVFISIAFWGIIETNNLVSAITTQWIFKVTYETLATPITYSVVNFLKREEQIDAFDYSG